MSSYLDRLPDGLDSYPALECKGSIWRSALEHIDADLPLPEGLPPELQTLWQDPPTPTSWLPEVHSIAAQLAIMDVLDMGEPEAQAWSVRTNSHLIRSQMYAILVDRVPTGLLLKTATKRFSVVRRGTVLRSDFEDGAGRLFLDFPPHSVPPEFLWMYTKSWEVIVLASAATRATCELLESTPTSAVFGLSWSQAPTLPHVGS